MNASLWQRIKKIAAPYRERLGKSRNILQRHIPLTSLDAANVIAVETSAFRKFFLRIAAVLSQGAQSPSEEQFDGCLRHLIMVFP